MLSPLLLLSSFFFVHSKTVPPDVHDWIQRNIHICDLDPSFGRTRFLTVEEVNSFSCRCGDPLRTGLACAQHLERRPFCTSLPSACLFEWRMQFSGSHTPSPTLRKSSNVHFNTQHTTRLRLTTAGRGNIVPLRRSTVRGVTVSRSTVRSMSTSPHPTLITVPTTQPSFTRPPPVTTKTILFETFPPFVVSPLEEEKRKALEGKLIEHREENSKDSFIRVVQSSTTVKHIGSIPPLLFEDGQVKKRVIDTPEMNDEKRRESSMVNLKEENDGKDIARETAPEKSRAAFIASRMASLLKNIFSSSDTISLATSPLTVLSTTMSTPLPSSTFPSSITSPLPSTTLPSPTTLTSSLPPSSSSSPLLSSSSFPLPSPLPLIQTTSTVISTTTVPSTTRRSKYTTRVFNPRICEDNHSLCPEWSKYSECERNPGFMFKFCRLSCGICAIRRR